MSGPHRAIAAPDGAYVLSFRDVAEVLSAANLGELFTRLADEIEAVYGDTSVQPVRRLGWPLHSPSAREIMACAAADYTCVKLISSVPDLEASPTVTGTLICTDVATEHALLVCDAAFLTPLRTAATSAAIMRQVVPEAQSLGIVGAGLEGIAHAVALTSMIKSIGSIYLLDIDYNQAASAAREIKYLLERDDALAGRDVRIECKESEAALYECDALVTATFAESASDVLSETGNIRDGTFIAAVGADLQKKRELPDQLYERAKFIADDLRQCLEDGELQYAKQILCAQHGEPLVKDHRGSLLEGRIQSAADFFAAPSQFNGRAESVTIYDSAGFSGQDLAMARVMLELLKKSDVKCQPWNPPGSRSLVDLLGCNPLFGLGSLSQKAPSAES